MREEREVVKTSPGGGRDTEGRMKVIVKEETRKRIEERMKNVINVEVKKCRRENTGIRAEKMKDLV